MEQRRLPRAPLNQALVFKHKGSDEPIAGVAKDISLGGMYIETATPPPFNSEIIVLAEYSAERWQLQMPAVVRWTKPGGMGIQFKLLGARETHMITELTRNAK